VIVKAVISFQHATFAHQQLSLHVVYASNTGELLSMRATVGCPRVPTVTVPDGARLPKLALAAVVRALRGAALR
jgi:hypothetical protein